MPKGRGYKSAGAKSLGRKAAKKFVGRVGESEKARKKRKRRVLAKARATGLDVTAALDSLLP